MKNEQRARTHTHTHTHWIGYSMQTEYECSLDESKTRTNDVIKYSCFHDIKQSGPGVVWCILHNVIPTVVVILFPTVRKDGMQMQQQTTS